MKLTIAIPSYNRPETLIRLLKSIDFKNESNDVLIDILIHEDNSPRRVEIRSAVMSFIAASSFPIKYYENQINMGYDANLWTLVDKSTGDFILFMGDDDEFVPGSLNLLISFLKKNNELGYVLKSHYTILKDGSHEIFNYYSGDQFFNPGTSTIVEMFRKSVLISGFCIRREDLYNYYTTNLNGTLLIQLYFLAIVAMKYKCAYFSPALTFQRQEGNVPFFGSSENEKGLYSPGEKSIQNSINFSKSFLTVLSYIDNTLSIKVKDKVVLDMSKYFYPSLSIQRNRGRKAFYKYFRELNKLGFNTSIYYYVYFIALYIFGKSFCDSIIRNIKRIIRVTPKL